IRLGNFEVAQEAVHTTRAGRRLLVTHGDQFDALVRGRSLGVLLGALACRWLLALNRFVHWLHDLTGRPYWSLAQHVKSRFGGARRSVARFQDCTLAAAREAGVDGVVCGHIHMAKVEELDGLLYCNDGDWVESCTALVENQAGEVGLVHWRPPVHVVASSIAAVPAFAGAPRHALAAEFRQELAAVIRLVRRAVDEPDVVEIAPPRYAAQERH